MPALAMELGCAAWPCRACWSDFNFGQVLRIHAATGELAESFAEGFAGDDWAAEVAEPSFEDYECTDAAADAQCGTSTDGSHRWHCR